MHCIIIEQGQTWSLPASSELALLSVTPCGMRHDISTGDQGLVTPEWARQRGRDADEAVTAPPLAHPGSSGRPSRSVARRLNIDQACSSLLARLQLDHSCEHAHA